MRRKQIFLLIFVILNLLAMLFFLSFSFPQIYIKNKLFVSETFEPPANFELQLNPGHGYFVEVAMHETILTSDLELN